VRIVLDTNVLVAGLLNPAGACGRLHDLVLDGTVSCSADERVLREYEEVLRRPHLVLPADTVREVLTFLRHSAEPVVPLPLDAKLPDSNDLPFLEVAAAAGAVLVTGNLRHYPKKAIGCVSAVSPVEGLNLLRRSA
jgi:putative PIN family toxin of toxin-antitoxin system